MTSHMQQKPCHKPMDTQCIVKEQNIVYIFERNYIRFVYSLSLSLSLILTKRILSSLGPSTCGGHSLFDEIIERLFYLFPYAISSVSVVDSR